MNSSVCKKIKIASINRIKKNIFLASLSLEIKTNINKKGNKIKNGKFTKKEKFISL